MTEIIIPLPNGGSVRCGPGDTYWYGKYVRICDQNEVEIVYWDKAEWEQEEQGEAVMGSIFALAKMPIDEMLKELKKTKIVDKHWE